MIKLNNYNINTIIFIALSFFIVSSLLNYKSSIIDTFFTSTTNNPQTTQTTNTNFETESETTTDTDDTTTTTTTNTPQTNSTNLTTNTPSTTIQNIVSATTKKPKVYNNERFIKSFSVENHLEPFGYYNKGNYSKEIEIKPNITHEDFLKSKKNKQLLLF